MNERIDIVIFVFFVAFAATIACASFPATRAAGERRSAEARVTSCLAASNCRRQEIVRCYVQSEDDCRSRGLERKCAYDAPTGACRP